MILPVKTFRPFCAHPAKTFHRWNSSGMAHPWVAKFKGVFAALGLLFLASGQMSHGWQKQAPTVYLEQSIRQGNALPRSGQIGIEAGIDFKRIVFLPKTVSAASEPVPMSEEQVIRELSAASDEKSFLAFLLNRNPDLKAARAGQLAAGLEIPQATALEITLSQYSGFLDASGVTIPVPGLFPFPGIISQKLGIARANAAVADFQTKMAERKLTGMAAALIVKVWFLKNLQGLLRENLRLARDIHQLVLRLYKDGKADFADLVGARVRQETLRTKLIGIDDQLKALAARGASLLDLTALPLSAFPAPARLILQHLPAIEKAQTFSHSHRQELLILSERQRKISLMLEMISRMTTPDLAMTASLPLTQGAGEIRRTQGRKGTFPGTMVRSHPAFGFFQAIIGQMKALRESIAQSQKATALDIRAEIEILASQANTARETLRITKQAILPDLKASIESLMALYENGRATFADLVQGETRWIDARKAELEAHRDLLLVTIDFLSAQGRVLFQEEQS